MGALVEQEKERLRGTSNPLSGRPQGGLLLLLLLPQGGLGEPGGGETRSRTTTNLTQPPSSSDRPAKCYQVTFTGLL